MRTPFDSGLICVGLYEHAAAAPDVSSGSLQWCVLQQDVRLPQILHVREVSQCVLCLYVGETITCKSVVITTGTFLRGIIHVGSKTRAAGRMPSLDSQVSLYEKWKMSLLTHL